MIELQENREPLPVDPLPPEPEKPVLLMLDLGCGQRPQPGFKGVDIARLNIDYPDVDLFNPPFRQTLYEPHDTLVGGRLCVGESAPLFEDNSVDEIHCSHFFEHVPADRRFAFMDEVYRILKPGKRILIICPHGSGDRAAQDPTHAWPPIVDGTFLYFNKAWREANGLDHYNVKCNFDAQVGHSYMPHWEGRSEDSKAFAAMHYRNVIMDIHASLVKLA
jgi:SAM-dependent methyltransferase